MARTTRPTSHYEAPRAWFLGVALITVALAPACGPGSSNGAGADAATGDTADVGDFASTCPAADSDGSGTAELTARDDGTLRDDLGRDVILRGINTGGRSKWAPYAPFDLPDPDDTADFDARAHTYFQRLERWGLDTARMPFSWEGLEPESGRWNDAYLDRYARMVDIAWEHEVGVVVDFHQDVFSSQFCGDGFPPWTVADIFDGPARRDCDDWFTGYLTNADVAAAFDRLWDPESDLRAGFVEMWTRVATRFADHPGVIGFEIINEPHWGSAQSAPWKRDVLQPFHTEMAAMLHRIAPTKLVFYDSTGIDAVAPPETHERPDGDFLVFAPHFYDFGLLAGREPTSPSPAPMVARFETVRETYGVHVMIGEFGYTHGAEQGGAWLAETMNAVDTHRLSTTLWEYSESAELWNGEDLSVVNGDGDERPILDVYVRPWLRAVAGTEPEFDWNPESLSGTAAWTADGGVTEIRLPARTFGEPASVEVTPDTACAFHDVTAGKLRVSAPAGTRVSVTFEP